MIGSRIKETASGTGTADITLSGAVSGHLAINTVFPLNRRFSYYIIMDDNSAWESGIGYLSAATTLVRERPKRTSSGTGTAINFAAGPKTVICDFLEGSYAAGWPGVYGTNKDVGPANVTFNLASSMTSTADRLYLAPWRLDAFMQLTHLVANVDGAVAGSKARFAFYQWLPDGNPGPLLAETGDIDTTTTGVKVGAVTGITLFPGWYFAACISSGAVAYLAQGRAEMLSSPVGGGGYNVSLYQTLAVGWTAVPANPTVSGVGDVWGGSCPGVYLRGIIP